VMQLELQRRLDGDAIVGGEATAQREARDTYRERTALRRWRRPGRLGEPGGIRGGRYD